MFTVESPVFVLVPSPSNERILHPGTVKRLDNGNIVAEFAESLPLEVGADVNLYAEVRGKFFQQGAGITLVEPSGGEITGMILKLSPVGQPVSAESRATYRVSAANAGLVATVGREKNCPVADVSPEGLAIISRNELAVGSAVDVALVYENQSFSGRARVQTVKTLASGKIRYGLLLPDRKSPMRKMLQQLTSDLQRVQLRRLARSA